MANLQPGFHVVEARRVYGSFVEKVSEPAQPGSMGRTDAQSTRRRGRRVPKKIKDIARTERSELPRNRGDNPSLTTNVSRNRASKVTCPATLIGAYPEIDMSSAILLAPNSEPPSSQQASTPQAFDKEEAWPYDRLTLNEQLDLVPNFYASSVKSCLFPIRKVQDELVQLYFRNIHPLLPVLDEHHFVEMHERYKGKEELMDPGFFLLYQAVMAASFSHLAETDFQHTCFKSLTDGQEMLFAQVKLRYWANITTDPLILTQLTLIISLWSFGLQRSEDRNSYWLDMAFKHANKGKLWSQETQSNSPSGRLRLIWWCCLVRDRHLAIVLRRPYRLHEIPHTCPVVNEDDFGVEAKRPCFTDVRSKRLAIIAFKSLCELSKIMARIAEYQKQIKFSQSWNGNLHTASSLLEAHLIVQDLDSWRLKFERAVQRRVKLGVITFSLPVDLVRLIGCSLLTILYQPLLHINLSDSVITEFRDVDPHERVMNGTYAVNAVLKDIWTHHALDGIPPLMVGWFYLPLLCYKATSHTHGKNESMDAFDKFLENIKPRDLGIQIVLQLLDQLMPQLMEKIRTEDRVAMGSIVDRPFTKEMSAELISQLATYADTLLEDGKTHTVVEADDER